MQNGKRFETTDLALSAFLLSRGHTLLSTSQHNHRVTFYFPPSVGQEAQDYFKGATTVARSFYHALRDLRALIRGSTFCGASLPTPPGP